MSITGEAENAKTDMLGGKNEHKQAKCGIGLALKKNGRNTGRRFAKNIKYAIQEFLTCLIKHSRRWTQFCMMHCRVAHMTGFREQNHKTKILGIRRMRAIFLWDLCI